MLTITRLKLISQVVCFCIIVYLGYLGVKLIELKGVSLVLPTLSCYYTDHRVAQCFLRALQEGLSGGLSVGFTNLIAPIILLAVFGLLFGRSWCSWVCPLGFVQDVFIRIRKFLNVGYYNLSSNLKQASVFTRWFFVAFLCCVAVGISIPHFFLKEYQYDLITPFCQICPSKQIFPLVEGRFQELLRVDTISAMSSVMSYSAIAVFVFYLLTTSFVRRMWCRICPMGAVLGLCNRYSLLALRKEGKRCTKCGICQRSCPVQVTEVYEEKEKEKIAPSECTLCFRCVEMCPERDALRVGFHNSSIVRSKFRRFFNSSAIRISSKQKEKAR